MFEIISRVIRRNNLLNLIDIDSIYGDDFSDEVSLIIYGCKSQNPEIIKSYTKFVEGSISIWGVLNFEDLIDFLRTLYLKYRKIDRRYLNLDLARWFRIKEDFLEHRHLYSVSNERILYFNSLLDHLELLDNKIYEPRQGTHQRNRVWLDESRKLRSIGRQDLTNRCFCCGIRVVKDYDFSLVNRTTEDVFESSHIIPKSAGGSNDLNNIRVCCSLCNQTMRQRHMFEWSYSNLIKLKTPLPEDLNKYYTLGIFEYKSRPKPTFCLELTPNSDSNKILGYVLHKTKLDILRLLSSYKKLGFIIPSESYKAIDNRIQPYERILVQEKLISELIKFNERSFLSKLKILWTKLLFGI